MARAVRMSACWAGPLGAVREEDRPSWLMAAPRISALALGSGAAGSAPRPLLSRDEATLMCTAPTASALP